MSRATHGDAQKCADELKKELNETSGVAHEGAQGYADELLEDEKPRDDEHVPPRTSRGSVGYAHGMQMSPLTPPRIHQQASSSHASSRLTLSCLAAP